MNYWRTKFIVSFDVEQAGDGVCAVVGRLSLVRSQQSNRNRNTKEKERNIFIRKEMSIKVNCVCSRASPFNPASDPSGPVPLSSAGQRETHHARRPFLFFFILPAARLIYLQKYTTSPDTEEKQTQRIQIDRNFSQYAAQSDTATFFSLSRRRNSPPYYRPSINTTVAALIPPAPLQMRINIKEQKKKIKRRRRKEKKEKIIKKK